jgi:hypothetical protein
MPEDWYLTWYGHEYTATLLPEASWQAQTDWAALVEETQSHFQCYLGCSVLNDVKLKILAKAQAYLGKKLGGLLCQHPVPDPEHVQLNELGIRCLGPETHWAMGIGEQWAAAVDVQPTTSKSDRLLETGKAPPGLIISGQSAPNLRHLRGALHGLAQGAHPDRPGFLLLEPGPNALHNLETCQQLMALMGLGPVRL